MTYFKDQKENPPAMEEEFDDLTQSSETASASSRFPSPNYEDLLKLIEHLSLECKGRSAVSRAATTAHSA